MLQNTEPVAPAYRRIQYALRKRIEAGELQPGDAVPSERELARNNEVSLMTARHALANWSTMGWWTGARRRNVRVAAQDPLQPPGQLHRANGQPGLPARSRSCA